MRMGARRRARARAPGWGRVRVRACRAGGGGCGWQWHLRCDGLERGDGVGACCGTSQLEWPGQGISPSAYPCDTALHQTTEACTTHSELLTEFCSLISSCHHRVSLIAHSMGCLNAIRSSAKFSKSVYVCPLIYPCLPLPPFPAAIVCGFMRRLRGSRTGTIKPRRVRSHVLPRAGITGNVTNLVAWEWIRMEAPELM